MGNWRRVNMIGSCDMKDLSALREEVNTGEDWDRFHCLSNTGHHGLGGLNDWVHEKISAIGNLAERDYSVESIVETLQKLVQAAPSLTLTVHCGDDWESSKCIATITVKDGKVVRGDPTIPELMEISEEQIMGNLMKALSRKRI